MITIDETPTLEPSEPPPSRGVIDDVRHLPTTARDFVVDGFRHLFVGPVRRGRPRVDGRSPGMRTIVAVGVGGYVLCVLIVLFGGMLRAGLDLSADADGSATLSMPRGLLWLVVTLVVISFSLLQTGALHAPVWLRIIVLCVSVLGFAFVGTADLGVRGGYSTSMIVALCAGGLLVTFQAIRWRSAPRWWEFVVVLALVTIVVTVAYSSSRSNSGAYGIDALPSFTTLLFFLLGELAIPMTIVSGISAAEVGVSASTWSTGFIGSRVSFLVVGFLALAFGVVRIRDSVTGALRDGDGNPGAWHQVTGAVVLGLLLAGLWLALDRVADRHAAGSSTVDHVVSDVQSIAIVVAVLLSITALPVTLVRLAGQVVFSIDRDADLAVTLNDWADWLSEDSVLLASRVFAGVALIGLGIVFARRGRRGPAELAGVIGLVVLAGYATDRGAVLESFGGWERAIDAVGIAAIIALVVVRARKRTLTPQLMAAILLLLMLTVLLTKRDFVSNPLSIVLGFAGVGFILFGYVWNFITGAEAVNQDSDRFPRDARTLLFLALNLFGLTVLAWASLVRSTSFGTDLGPWASLGDNVIGIPLIIAAFAALYAAVARGDHG